MSRISRRHLLLRVVPLGVAGVALARSALGEESCVQPDSESLRASLSYVSEAEDAAQSCEHCAFFTTDPVGSSCGSCTIMAGPVDATGHCESWSPLS